MKSHSVAWLSKYNSAELTIVRVTFDEPYYEMRTYFVRNGLVDEEEIEFEN